MKSYCFENKQLTKEEYERKLKWCSVLIIFFYAQLMPHNKACVDCYNCNKCIKCTDCKNCDECVVCVDAVECDECISSNKCFFCLNCEDCNECDACINC